MNLKHLTLVLAVVFGTAACDTQHAGTAPESSPGTGSPALPRYQVVFSPHVRADTFLLDTQKGRVWVLAKFSDIPGEPSAFDEIDVIDNGGEIGIKFTDFFQLHSSTQAAERKSRKPPNLLTDEQVGFSSAKGDRKGQKPRPLTFEEFNAPGKSSQPKGGTK